MGPSFCIPPRIVPCQAIGEAEQDRHLHKGGEEAGWGKASEPEQGEESTYAGTMQPGAGCQGQSGGKRQLLSHSLTPHSVCKDALLPSLGSDTFCQAADTVHPPRPTQVLFVDTISQYIEGNILSASFLCQRKSYTY